jgi:hypothetical protein
VSAGGVNSADMFASAELVLYDTQRPSTEFVELNICMGGSGTGVGGCMCEPEPVVSANWVYLAMGVSGKESNLLFTAYCNYNYLETLAADPNYGCGPGG